MISKPYLIPAFTPSLVSKPLSRHRFVPVALVLSPLMAKMRSERGRRSSGSEAPSRSAGGKRKRAAPKKGAKHERATPKSTGKWFPSVAMEGEIKGYKDDMSMPVDLKVCIPSREAPPEPCVSEHVLCSGYFRRGLGFLLHPFMHGLLYFLGCQLQHIPPNGVLHIANFIIFCE